MITAMTEATTGTGERRKLQKRSLSRRRCAIPIFARGGAAAASAAMEARGGAGDPQPRINRVVKQVDDEVDDDEDKGDEDEIGGHHRDVDAAHRLDEHEADAGPLE